MLHRIKCVLLCHVSNELYAWIMTNCPAAFKVRNSSVEGANKNEDGVLGLHLAAAKSPERKEFLGVLQR